MINLQLHKKYILPYIYRGGDDALCKCVQDGITIEFGIKDTMWCCKTTSDKCIQEGLNIVTCNGTALSLSHQCYDENYDGPSCNYYPLSSNRHGNIGEPFSRSYLDLCQDNR